MKGDLVKQALRFIVVGGLFTLLDVGLHHLLMYDIHVHSEPLGLVFGRQIQGAVGGSGDEAAQKWSFFVFKVLTATIAIINSFYWNRRWTFEAGDQNWKPQLGKYVVLCASTTLINIALASAVYSAVQSWLVSTACAVAVITLLNFAGQRHWVFKKKP